MIADFVVVPFVSFVLFVSPLVSLIPLVPLVPLCDSRRSNGAQLTTAPPTKNTVNEPLPIDGTSILAELSAL